MGLVRAAGSIVEHGHSVALHDCIWSQGDGFKGAEENQGEFLVLPLVPEGASWAHCALKEQPRFDIPQESLACQIQIRLEIEGLKRRRIRRIVWLWCN